MSIGSGFKKFVSIAREVLNGWGEDKAWMLAAALSFFTILSLAPLLIIAVAVAGMVFGERAARQETVTTVTEFAGPQAASVVGQVLEGIARPGATLTASIIGFAVIFAGASGVFWQLRMALNVIWKVDPRKKNARDGILSTIKGRLLTLAFALGMGLLLLFSLASGPLLSAIAGAIPQTPGGAVIWRIVDIVAVFAVTALIFAIVFRYVPERLLPWKPVLVGGLFTSVLFNIGRYIIGAYLGGTSIASVYGAAGSLVVFLLWVYYSAQIMLLGGEFTMVYSRRRAPSG